MVARAFKQVWVSLALVALMACVVGELADVGAQAPGRPSRARNQLTTGIDCLRHGDLELAERFFQQAKAGEEDLSPAERQELSNRIQYVETALKARTDGANQLRQAADAVRENRTQEALTLLKDVLANPHLKAADRQQAQQLMDQLQPRTAAPAPVLTSTTGSTLLLQARAKLKNARGLLLKGEFDAAEQLAKEARTISVTYESGEDTPQKVLDDVSRARSARNARKDARSLLSAARAALDRGDLDTAETLARESEKAESFWTFHWFGDSPNKVLRDVKDARARAAAAQLKASTKDSSAASPGKSPTRDSGRGEDSGIASAAEAEKLNAAERAKFAPPPASKTPTPLAQSAPTSQGTPVAKSPEPGKESSTEAVAHPGQTSKTVPAVPSANPRNLQPKDAPLARNNAAASTPSKTSVLAGAAGKGTVAAVPVPATSDTDSARQLLKQGRKALQESNVAEAERLAREARSKKPDLNWWEDNPDKLLADIRRVAPPAAPAATRGDKVAAKDEPKTDDSAANPRALLRQARDLYQHGKLEDAKELALKANSHGVRWGLFEDSPDKLLSDIQSARTKRDREESVRMLAEARKLYQEGRLDEAERLAYQAERLHGSYSIWDLGDRPHKLVADIEAARIRNRRLKTSPATQVAQNDQGRKDQPVGGGTQLINEQSQKNATGQNFAAPAGGPSMVQQTGGTPTTPPTADGKPAYNTPLAGGGRAPTTPAQDFARQQARKLLAECRDFQKKSQLIESLEKAREAQRVGASFDPFEDSPERALRDLAIQAQQQIDAHVRNGANLMAQGATDPAKFRQAESELLQARRVASAFGLDLLVIDQRLAALRQLEGQAVAQAQLTPQMPSYLKQAGHEDDKRQRGLQLLDQARLELKRGETGMARRIAEEAFSPEYGVQAEAAALLRSIDAEDWEQNLRALKRKVDVAVDAYRRKDFAQAWTALEQIDESQLPPDQQARVKNVKQSADMQRFLAQRNAPYPGADGEVVQATGTEANAETFAQQVQAMQEIKFQKLFEDGRQAQRDALQRVQANRPGEALDILQSYKNRLEESGLEPDRISMLRRPIDAKLAQYRTLKSQTEWKTLMDQKNDQVWKQQAQRVLNEQTKRNSVKELMDRYNAFLKEAKYDDAVMVAMKAHELDPDNPATGAAMYTARILRNQDRANKAKQRGEDFRTFNLTGAEDVGAVVYDEHPLDVNKDRMAVAGRRPNLTSLMGTRKSEKERDIERKLQMPVAPLNFKNTPLGQVIDDLRDITGLNIITDQPALDEEGIRADRPMTMKLEGVSLKSALNVLLRQANLTYVIKDEVLQITTPKHASGKQVQKTYAVADLVIPVDNYMISPAANLMNVIASNNQSNVLMNGSTAYQPRFGLNGGQTVSSSGTSENQPAHDGHGAPPVNLRASTRAPGQTDSLHELLIRLITQNVAPHTWSEAGGHGTIDYFPLGMALVINQTPDIQEQVQELLDALRRLQDLEISVEVRMISLEETFFERIGLDFNLNIKTDRITTPIEPQIVTQQFKPLNFINDPFFRRLIVGLQPAASGESFSPTQGLSALTPDLDIPIRNSSFRYAIPPFGGYPNIPGANGGLSMGLAFLNDIEVFMFMEAAQGDRRTNVMQAPKLTLFNGQTSTIQIQDFQWFVTNVQVVQNGGQVVFVPQQQPIPLGINLAIQAVVDASRRFVRLNIAPTMSNLASATVPLFPITTFIVPVFEGGAQGQPVPFTQFIQQPTITTITIQTTVSVPDGGTVLLGGLKLMNEGRNEFGPPVLSKIPYLNRLFKNVGYGRDTSSLLLMVTPRIIINAEEEFLQTGVDSFNLYGGPRP